MAYDEAFCVHEKMIVPVRILLGDDDLGIFYFAWSIPGIALILILGLFFSKFMLRLPATTRFRFLMAAAFYIGGAIGVELLGGRYAELHGQDNFSYSMLTTVEEGLEMVGLIVFVWALLKYCANTYEDVNIRFLN